MRAGIAVWDLPTRAFHWLLVLLFGFSWWSAENGLMDWHRLSGTALLGLILFRLLWGLVGGSTARFAHFLRSPARALAYVRGRAAPRAGHNPLGGYSVVALLALLVFQVATGLFAVDVDGIESGPLSYLVSFDLGRSASLWHERSFNLLLALIGVHVAAVLFYLLFRKRNLVTPMVTGRDPALEGAEGTLERASRIRFILVAVVATLSACWIGSGMPL